MKFTRYILLNMILLCGTLVAVSQSKLVKKGDKSFKNLSFIEALENYQSALARDTSNPKLKLKIADSYRMLNNPEQAEKWYAQAEESAFSPIDKLHYAEALSSNGNYEEAKKWYQEYKKERAKDERAEVKIASIENQQIYFKNSSLTTVSEVDFNSTSSDFSPAFYGENLVFPSARDKKERTFDWDKSKYLELFVKTDNGVSKFLDEFNTKYHEGPLVFYDNDTKVIFTRNNYSNNKVRKSSDGINKLKLYYSEKTADGWSEVESLPFNSDEYSVGHPAISSDGKTLYFVSDMPGSIGGTDIYKSEYTAGKWQKPVNLGEIINTEGNEMFPYLLNDHELYFASNGHGGLGGLDMFGIDLLKGENGDLINLGAPINTGLDDFGMILNKSGLSGYFSSNRMGGTGNDDIYSFKTKRAFLLNLIVKGIATDENSGAIIPGATVRLTDNSGNILSSITADEKGRYSFPIEFDQDYTIKAVKEEYFEGTHSFSTKNSGDKTEYEEDVTLVKDYGFSLYGLITDHKTEAPLTDVQVKIIDNITGKTVLEKETPASGDFRSPIIDKKLNDRISYQVQLSKQGYLGKTVTYNATLDSPGEIRLDEKLNISLDKIDVGTDIGKLIEINPIYFDLNKSNIRPDAAAELNKIVKVMNENPTLEIELGSHTDSRGSDAYNLSLSDRRAKSSAAYIVSQGIDKSRITGKGYGESLIINQCTNGVRCSKEDHQLNRRTEFKITKY
ncbi:MAG: OmpA family protein [Bacteroidota bacterium]